MKSFRFRRTRPKGEKTSFTLKDWILTSISVIAFLVSMATTYFTYVVRKDYVSVIAGTLPTPAGSFNEKRLELLGNELNLIFINGGTRSAVVRDADLNLVAFDQDREGEACEKPRRSSRE